MKQSYCLTLPAKTSLSAYDLVQFFNQYHLDLSLERELDKTQGHFPMHFSGNLLKCKKNISWESSFEVYPYKDSSSQNDTYTLIVHTYNCFDELSFAYLSFYFSQHNGVVTHFNSQVFLDIDALILDAENQVLNEEKTVQAPLIEDYYTEANPIERLAEKVMQRIKQTQSSMTPLSDLNVIVHSNEFNQVKDCDVFLEKLVIFLDENQLSKEALSILRSSLYPNKKKEKVSALPIMLIIIGIVLSILITITDETFSSLFGCLVATFGFIPFYLVLRNCLPKLHGALSLLFSSYLTLATFMSVAIISEIFFILSYEVYDFFISIAAMSMIQSIIATILVLFYGFILLIKKALSY